MRVLTCRHARKERGAAPQWKGGHRAGITLSDQPLQDAGVLSSGGDEAAVVMQECNAGHVTAVAAILVARRLEDTIFSKFQVHSRSTTKISR